VQKNVKNAYLQQYKYHILKVKAVLMRFEVKCESCCLKLFMCCFFIFSFAFLSFNLLTSHTFIKCTIYIKTGCFNLKKEVFVLL